MKVRIERYYKLKKYTSIFDTRYHFYTQTIKTDFYIFFKDELLCEEYIIDISSQRNVKIERV